MDIVFYDLDAYVEPCQTSAMELFCENQKQPFRGVLEKWCSENIQQIYIRHPCQSAISISAIATLLKSHFGMGVLL